MAPRVCALCDTAKAVLKRPKTGQKICRDCFFYVFETEVHNTITQAKLFKHGDRVAIGASGGKGRFSFLVSRCTYGEYKSCNRFNGFGLCNEDFERAISVWSSALPAFHRRGNNWVQR